MTVTAFEDSLSVHRAERMRALYEVNAGPLFRTLIGWSNGDEKAAEDLVQETMLRAWRHLDELNDDPRSVRPWLLTVAKRLAIDALRARAARPREVRDDTLALIASSVEPYEALLDRQVLRDAMASLSETHREVLIQTYYLQRTVKQVAENLGIPEGTVKSRAYNGLRALRKALPNESRGIGHSSCPA